MDYEKRIKELNLEIQQRTDRLQKFVAQNAQNIEQEKAIIQQKTGGIQVLKELQEELKESKKDKGPKKVPEKT